MKHLKQTTKKTLGEELTHAVKEALQDNGEGELVRSAKEPTACPIINNKKF